MLYFTLKDYPGTVFWSKLCFFSSGKIVLNASVQFSCIDRNNIKSDFSGIIDHVFNLFSNSPVLIPNLIIKLASKNLFGAQTNYSNNAGWQVCTINNNLASNTAYSPFIYYTFLGFVKKYGNNNCMFYSVLNNKTFALN
jgi:hypothetical protein